MPALQIYGYILALFVLVSIATGSIQARIDAMYADRIQAQQQAISDQNVALIRAVCVRFRKDEIAMSRASLPRLKAELERVVKPDCPKAMARSEVAK